MQAACVVSTQHGADSQTVHKIDHGARGGLKGQKGGLRGDAASAVSDGVRPRSRVQNLADSGIQSNERDRRDKEPVNAVESPLVKADSGTRSAASPPGREKLRQGRGQAWNSLGRQDHVMSAGPACHVRWS